MKVKDLKFDEFQFDTTRKLLNIRKDYNNHEVYINMQLDTTFHYNIFVFNARLIIQKRLSNGQYKAISESAFFNMNLEKVLEEHSTTKTISKQYMPMVLSAIQLYKEVNQDFFNGVV